MTHDDDRSLERAARSWLEAGPTRAPDHAVDAALLRIQTTAQERNLPLPWRLPTFLDPVARLAMVAVVLVLAVGGGYLGLRALAPSTGGQPPTVEGTWEVSFTRQELLAAGLTAPSEDDPSNYGHFILTLSGGRGGFVQEDGPKASGGGAYTVDPFGQTLTLCPVNGPPFTMPFSVTETTLTFGRGGLIWFRVKPWTRIELPTGQVPLPSVASCPTASPTSSP
jgi:hypothetical protein